MSHRARACKPPFFNRVKTIHAVFIATTAVLTTCANKTDAHEIACNKTTQGGSHAGMVDHDFNALC